MSQQPEDEPPSIKNVVVIFGDPRKADPLKPSSVFDDDDIYTINRLKKSLKNIRGYQFKYLDNHDSLPLDLIKLKPKIDFVFNLCDEGFNNDPQKELHIPAYLEMLNISYTGATPQCLAFCYDKSLVRGVAKEMKVPVPGGFFINPRGKIITKSLFTFPLIAKPNFGDGSYGITQNSVVKNKKELSLAVSEIRKRFGYDKPILVEEFLVGKDLTVGIIGNPPRDLQVLPILREDYSVLPRGLPQICGYEAKWFPTSPYWKIKSVPAKLSRKIEQKIIDWCQKLFIRLGCCDYARFDWRLDRRGNPKLLEVNPNPGWCWDGHLAKMSKAAGISYTKMLEMILNSAEKRIRDRTKFL